MVEPFIQVRELTRLYGKHEALRQVSFDVAKGEIYGMLGSNGSGKSTLLRILAGGLRATQGSYQMRGTFGYVSQRFGLYEDLLVEENITFYARAQGLSGNRLTAATSRSLELLGLQGMRQRQTRELSHGWKHRLAIASAICHEPHILILDEPTAGIDPVARAATWEILAGLARAGTSVLTATHHLDEAERCDRIGFLDSGRLLTSSTPTDLCHRGGQPVTLSAALAAIVNEGRRV